jgi:hypothetical protein
MKKVIQYIFTLLVIAFFAIGSGAQALINNSGSINGSVSAQTSGKGSDDEDKNSVSSGGSLQVTVGDQKENEEMDDQNNEATDDSDQNVNSNSSADTNTSVKLGPIVIARSKAMKEDAVSMKDPDSVSNRADLESFLTASAQNDENLETATASENEVSVRYKEPAKFFGFIPVMITTHVKADTNGSIKVRYPWYRFLVALQDHDLQSEIEAKVNAVLLANGAKNTSAEFSASMQAHLINEIRAALQESYRNIKNPNASLNASTNTDTSINGNSNADASGNTDANTTAGN